MSSDISGQHGLKDEKVLFEDKGIFNGRWNASQVTDKGIHLKRRGSFIDIPYEELDCLQYNYSLGYHLDKDDSHRVYLYSRGKGRQMIECNGNLLPEDIREHALRSRSGISEAGDYSELENELVEGIEHQVDWFRKKRHASVRGACIPIISEVLGDSFRKNIRDKSGLFSRYWLDPVLIFDKWLVAFQTGHVRDVSLINREDIYFTYFTRRYNWEKHESTYTTGSGINKSRSRYITYSEDERINRLFVYTPSERYIFRDVDYSRLSPFLDSMNPHYEELASSDPFENRNFHPSY